MRMMKTVGTTKTRMRAGKKERRKMVGMLEVTKISGKVEETIEGGEGLEA